MQYSFRVLGGTRVQRPDGTEVSLGGARLRALLTALAVAGGRTVRLDALAAEIWGDEEEPPAEVPAALQALVARLRRALGRETIERDTVGYRLVVERDDIDLFRFERLVDEGAAALADGSPEKAVVALTDALALWQGEPLADLAGAPAPTVAAAHSRRLAARRHLLEAELALGRAESALPGARALAAEHPLDEPAHALYLRALRDAGRRAEALAAYEAVRAHLADRLGTDPGAELRALHAELLREDEPTAETRRASEASAGRPAPSSTPSAGQRRAGNLRARLTSFVGRDEEVAMLARELSAARLVTLTGPGGAGKTRLSLEAAELAVADPSSGGSANSGAGAGGSAVSGSSGSGSVGAGCLGAGVPGAGLLNAGSSEAGAPGSGSPSAGVPNTGVADTSSAGTAPKSGSVSASSPGRGPVGPTVSVDGLVAKAQQAAGARWADGVWLAELAPVRDPATVPEAVLTALGGRETQLRGGVTAESLRAAEQPGDPLGQLAERCATRNMLLVLDNCEHVIDAAATLVERLLVECPGVTVLATSREPLGVPGEVVRPVRPLATDSALRLLADRGAAARAGFDVEDDPQACAELCRRLDGLPLAIELAAARLRSLTPRQLADRLDDRFRLLTSGSRTVLPRQQTLRAVVDWSWELLDGAERAVLRRLAVFSGGATLTHAEQVCGSVAPQQEPTNGGQRPRAAAVPPVATSAGLGHTPSSPLRTDVDPGHESQGAASGPGSSREDVRETHVEPTDVLALLASLVDKSLVIADPAEGAGGMRYRLLETVGEYAGERLDEAGEREATERRHLVAFRELARTSDPLLRGPEQRRVLDELEEEHDNLRTALARAVAARDEQEALCLTLSMSWFWQLRDHSTDVLTWAHATAELGPDPFAPPVAPAPDVATPVTAPPPLEEEVLVEARRAVRLLTLAGEDAQEHIDSPEFRERIDGVLAAYRPGQPQVCRTPGVMWIFAWLMSGRIAELPALLDTTVARCRETGDPWQLAFVLHLRAKMFNEQAETVTQSMRDAEECLALYAEVGDAWGEAEARSARAEARCNQGEFAEATEDLRRAIECAGRLGAEGQLPILRSRLGSALSETGAPGDLAEGAALLRDALDQSARQRGHGWHFVGLQYALYLLRFGPPQDALALLSSMEEELLGREPAVFRGVVQAMLARGYCATDDFTAALAKIREAFPNISSTFAMLFGPELAACQLPIAAWAHGALGAPELAARLLGTFDTAVPHRDQVPFPANPGLVEVRRTAEAVALAQLRAASSVTDDASAGSDASARDGSRADTPEEHGGSAADAAARAAFDAAYAQGRALTPVEAIALI